MEYDTEVCPICKGRGEVSAGITGGFVQTGQDEQGNPIGYPTWVKPNPQAIINNEIWILDINKLCPLWSTALCGKCRGKGFIWKK